MRFATQKEAVNRCCEFQQVRCNFGSSCCVNEVKSRRSFTPLPTTVGACSMVGAHNGCGKVLCGDVGRWLAP
jgi:hypothetical protein